MKTILLRSILLILTITSLSLLNAQNVTSSADDGSDGTLRQEILDTPAGGAVTFDSSVTVVMLNAEIVLDKDITITGNFGDERTRIDGQGMNRVFNVMSGNTLNLNTLTLSNGIADNGGAIYLEGSILNVDDCLLESNTANGSPGSGGAIFVNTGGSLVLTNSALNDNQANRAGGAIEDNSGAGLGISVIDTDFSNNNAGVAPATAAPGNGGAFHATGSGDSEFIACIIENNLAAQEGGGLWNGIGTMTVADCSFVSNIASGAAGHDGGGGIFNNGGTLNVSATDMTANIANGTSGTGGAILDLGGTSTIEGGTYSLNVANRAGGALAIRGGAIAEVSNVTLDNNTAGPVGFAAPGNGGGIHIGGISEATVTGSSFIGNKAANQGGGLWNARFGTLNIDDCSIEGNWSPTGGGVFGNNSANNSGLVTISNSTIFSNIATGVLATQGGAGIYNGSKLIITNSEVMNNTAEGTSGSGGGIFNASRATITGTTISGNTANRAGGGIEATAGSITKLVNVSLEDNIAGPEGSAAPGNGGGLHITGAGNALITNGSVSDNVAASEGGGLWNGSGTMTVNGTAIMSNNAAGVMADNGGAGLFNNGGTMVLSEVMIADNMATGASGSGGGILSTDGSVTMTDCQVLGNGANRAGGGIELINGLLTIDASDFVGNDLNGMAGTPAPGNGGAIHVTGNAAMAQIDMSIFFANEAANEGGALWNQSGSTMNVTNTTIDLNGALDGGGVFNNGGMTNITRSTLSENYALGDGGAISNETGTMSLMRSTVSSNFADGSGGGIYNSATLSIDASTVALNFALVDGGGVSSNGVAMIKNTIVAYNDATEGSDYSGTANSIGYNLIGTDDGSFAAQSTDLVNVDPLLDILQDNGGFTFTHNLSDDSPAIDAGSPDDLFNDQRDYAIIGTRDIGAVEFGGLEDAVTVAGMISTDDVTVICAGDGIGDPIEVTLTGGLGPDMIYVITDANGTILGLAPGPVFDLEGAGTGACLIYHLFYDANDISGLELGSGLADLAGNFGLSNSIEVIRNGGGCTDPSAANYDADACFDDGSCVADECVTETLSSLVQGWQMTGLVWNPGDLVAVQPLHTNYSVVPISGEEQGQTVEGIYIQGRFFIGLDEDFHADFAGPGYTANVNWSDFGTYVSSLPPSNTTAIFNLSGMDDENVLAFRWIGFLDADDDGIFTTGVDTYLGQLNQNGFALPADASGRLYVGFSDRLNQFSDNLGDLYLTYCYGEEFTALEVEAASRQEDGDTIDDEELQQLIATFGLQNEELEFSVYPNPNAGQFVIQSTTEISRYELRDMTGRIIQSEQVGSITLFEVESRNESSGIYMIQVYSNDGRTSAKRITIK